MARLSIPWTVLALAPALCAGCEDPLVGEPAPFAATCDRDPPLTYENFGDGILDRHCQSCHSVYVRGEQRGQAPLDVNFNSWDEVVDWADRILARAVTDDTMPPTGTMLPIERDQLGEWLVCEVLPAGARETVRRGRGPGEEGGHGIELVADSEDLRASGALVVGGAE